MDLQTLAAVTRDAGLMALRLGPTGRAQKDDGSWVTDADVRVEAALRERLFSLAPDIGFRGEEEGATGPDRRFWSVDPIDGTTNFLANDERWCVSIALIDPQGAQLGAVYQPARDRLWLAERGRGATLDGHSIQAVGPNVGLVAVAGRVPRSVRRLLRLARNLGGARSVRISGSTALDLAGAASGWYDRVVCLGSAEWDIAAGALLLTEAGGGITRRPGGRGWDIVATSRPEVG